jgi:hypothetical protein
MVRALPALALALVAGSAAHAAPPEAVSLFGEPLQSPELAESVRLERERCG